MKNIAKTQGLNYDAIIMELMKSKYRQMTKGFKELRKEKKNKIRKMKLNSQRKLGTITKPVSEKSTRNEAEAHANVFGKTKTAKDFEHYRKSKRPTRI